MFFDSHTHINHDGYTEEERMALINVIEHSNVDAVVDVAVDLVSSAMTAEHVKNLPWCYGAVGYHPHEAKDMGETELAMIRGLAQKDKIVAIGEIGLDFYYDHSERDVQREVFRKQIRLANELKMPIIIHSREADKETMDILKEEGAFSDERKSWFPKRPVPDDPAWKDAGADARVLLHCFSGSSETAKQYVKLGATISVAGPVTYKNNKKTVGVVGDIPIEFLLVETDAPFLAPEPLRGKRNVSPYITHTAGKVGEIKGLTLEETAEQTKKNAMRFFGIDAL